MPCRHAPATRLPRAWTTLGLCPVRAAYQFLSVHETAHSVVRITGREDMAQKQYLMARDVHG
jgi:hypothetical protein